MALGQLIAPFASQISLRVPQVWFLNLGLGLVVPQCKLGVRLAMQAISRAVFRQGPFDASPPKSYEIVICAFPSTSLAGPSPAVSRGDSDRHATAFDSLVRSTPGTDMAEEAQLN